MFMLLKAGLAGRRLPIFCVTFGISAGLALAMTSYCPWYRYGPVRFRAWKQVAPRIEQVAAETRAGAETSIGQVGEFFAERRQGARAFAADILSLGGKWEFVRGKFETGSHERYIEECFQRRLFRPDELKAAIESAVTRFVSEAQGRENRLLVDIRADLADGELAGQDYLPALHSEEEFHLRFQAVLEEILPILSRDVEAMVGREMVSFVASEIATQILTEIGTSLAIRLGLSGGILGTGAFTATASAGLTLIGGLLVDQAINWVMREAGYDPEGEIAAQVEASLARLESLILDGPTPADFPDYDFAANPLADPKFRVLLLPRGEPIPDEATMTALFLEFRSVQAREELARAAHERPGSLGLRNQLRRLDEGRSKLRKSALRRLILEGGVR